MEDGGIIDIELNEEAAPITCENFKKLVGQGFYNGLTFHRVIPNFMIQGGCPLGNGTGGPGWNIKGEFAANGVNNPIKHVRGVIDIELNEEAAPITCENFKKLVSEGFYNGLTFHRVIPGFMIQGGCPLGNGTGGPGWNIKGEFAANGVNNPLKHTRGVISMARAMNPNSAGSQFFIMHQDAPHLDGQYAAFGKVVAGMDVVDKIAAVRTDWNDKPTTPVKMKTVELIEG